MNKVWQFIIAADVVVLSISSFSFVPALLKRHGRVIYTPNPQTPLHHWTTVDPMITQNSVVELERMRQSCEGEAKKIPEQQPPTPDQSEQETVLPEDDDAPRTVHSLARMDSTGSFLHDMLMAHSYAFRNNLNYGGVCPDKEREDAGLYNQSLLIHQNVIDDLELSEIFRVDCPAEQSNETMIQHSEYWTPTKEQSEDLWTPVWLQHIYSKVRHRSRPEAYLTSVKEQAEDWWTPVWLQNVYSAIRHRWIPVTEPTHVVVHIQRGDVTPCDNADQYLPNSYYLELLGLLGVQHEHVAIYSESSSFESWEVFQSSDYSLMLDVPIQAIWEDILDADVVITSKSSFSIVPAMLNPQAAVYYTDHLIQPPAHWIETDETITKSANREVRRLRERCSAP